MYKTIATAPGEPPKHVKMTRKEIAERRREEKEAEAKRLEREHKMNRQKEYGTWQEQLDMLYHDKLNGTDTWMEHIQAVKERHPKPE